MISCYIHKLLLCYDMISYVIRCCPMVVVLRVPTSGCALIQEASKLVRYKPSMHVARDRAT